MATVETSTQHYYVPEKSRLAIFAAVSLFLIVMGGGRVLNSHTFDNEFNQNGVFLLVLGLVSLIVTLSCWFRITIVENRHGLANSQLKKSYVLAMQWFIFSEVMFFAAFFGALFYVRNISGPWLGGEGSGAMNHLLWEGFRFEWPLTTTPQQAVGGADNQSMANNGIFQGPTGLVHWNHIPLINTILLLSSSFTVHFAHLSLKNNKRKLFDLWLGISILLGLFFVTLQAVEYQEAYTELGLTLQSGIYGSTFFILTGFHGLHVTLGATMLLVQWLRSTTKGDFSAEDHFGFEAAAWYWHFVDVVWLGLFLFVYIF